jgi:hypothetical protein
MLLWNFDFHFFYLGLGYKILRNRYNSLFSISQYWCLILIIVFLNFLQQITIITSNDNKIRKLRLYSVELNRTLKTILLQCFVFAPFVFYVYLLPFHELLVLTINIDTIYIQTPIILQIFLGLTSKMLYRLRRCKVNHFIFLKRLYRRFILRDDLQPLMILWLPFSK